MDRVKNAFRETPWTAWLIAANLAVWLASFLGAPQPMMMLGGELDLANAWRWLTYPLASQAVAFWLLLGLFCFYLFASSLERAWGSLRFGRVFTVVVLLVAVSQWLGAAIVAKVSQPVVVMSGITLPALVMFVIWTSRNRESEILLFFVIPVKAKYVGIGTIVLTLLDGRGPLFSLPLVGLLAGCWFWAGRDAGRVSHGTAGAGIRQWWQARGRSQRKSRLQVLQGGASTPTPRAGGLHVVDRPPANPKLSESAEKELDRILDKIRHEGMESLTAEEKSHLDRQSQQLRGDTPL